MYHIDITQTGAPDFDVNEEMKWSKLFPSLVQGCSLSAVDAMRRKHDEDDEDEDGPPGKRNTAMRNHVPHLAL